MQRLGRMTQREVALPPEILESPRDISKKNTDFFIISKMVNDSFDSHKFRAQSEKQRDQWMHVVRTLLKKRLLSQAGENIENIASRLRRMPFSKFGKRDSLYAGNTPRFSRRMQVESSDEKIDLVDQRLMWSKVSLPIRALSEITYRIEDIAIPTRRLSDPQDNSKPKCTVEEMTVDFRKESRSLRVD